MVKQLLLRVPEDLHARLAARAQQQGRSVNSVANEVLEAHLTATPGPLTRDTLRARARALGLLAEPSAMPPLTPRQRAAAVESSKGNGPILDELLADGR